MTARWHAVSWAAAALVAVYAVALVAFSTPWMQRQALYAHWVLFPSFIIDVNRPEQVGFAPNQVTTFRLTTPDAESLYAWHILPSSVYHDHQTALVSQPTGPAADVRTTAAFQLLAADPEAKLVISFHGNAGNVAQCFRPDLYRSITGGPASKIHVLAVDYRGYGYSSGTPSEPGLTLDGITTVEWAMKVAGIAPDRIVLVGHSLGTAVTSAVVDYFAQKHVTFAGVVLVSGFSDLRRLLTGYPSYSIGGLVPVGPLIAPLSGELIAEKWSSVDHLANAARLSSRFRLHIIHALDDWDIPWHHASALFAAAANATTGGMDPATFEAMKRQDTVPTTHGGFISSWNTDRRKLIIEEVIPYGGHNVILAANPVAMAIFKSFE